MKGEIFPEKLENSFPHLKLPYTIGICSKIAKILAFEHLYTSLILCSLEPARLTCRQFTSLHCILLGSSLHQQHLNPPIIQCWLPVLRPRAAAAQFAIRGGFQIVERRRLEGNRKTRTAIVKVKRTNIKIYQKWVRVRFKCLKVLAK